MRSHAHPSPATVMHRSRHFRSDRHSLKSGRTTRREGERHANTVAVLPQLSKMRADPYWHQLTRYGARVDILACADACRSVSVASALSWMSCVQPVLQMRPKQHGQACTGLAYVRPSKPRLRICYCGQTERRAIAHICVLPRRRAARRPARLRRHQRSICTRSASQRTSAAACEPSRAAPPAG